jgi:hypothetical protein
MHSRRRTASPSRTLHRGGPARRGTDLDASPAYTLDLTGDPHPKQGHHVKLTIHAPDSLGADVKHKVFWVQPCDATTPRRGVLPGTTPPGITPPGGVRRRTTPPGNAPPGTTPPRTAPPVGLPGGANPAGPPDELPEAGLPLFAQPADRAPQDLRAAPPETAGRACGCRATEPKPPPPRAAVPTAVAAGLGGEDGTTSRAGDLATSLLGLGGLFVACAAALLAGRRRGEHQTSVAWSDCCSLRALCWSGRLVALLVVPDQREGDQPGWSASPAAVASGTGSSIVVDDAIPRRPVLSHLVDGRRPSTPPRSWKARGLPQPLHIRPLGVHVPVDAHGRVLPPRTTP